ncbi:MAG TPA: Fe-S cluster assembly protein NifU [Spirochaetota bacterium]|nr:Fe-S cluster assembly protein NifU [Spirochaetota bacterium]
MWEYTEKVKELYTHPINVGKIENADGVGHVGSVVCGDALTLYIKVDNGIITDAKFETFGCGSAIASSSALTEMIKGKTVEEAEKITNQDIVDFLGGLPDQKIHCSVMGSEALTNAIADYRGEKPPVEDEPHGEIICHCMNISDEDIRKAVHENGVMNIDDMMEFTGAGTVCGTCIPKIEDIIEEEKGRCAAKSSTHSDEPMTNLQKMKKIEEVINSVIRPGLKRDGGDIELVDINGDEVMVRLRGACSSCMTAQMTLENFVQQELRNNVSKNIIIKHV